MTMDVHVNTWNNGRRRGVGAGGEGRMGCGRSEWEEEGNKKRMKLNVGCHFDCRENGNRDWMVDG